MVVGCDLMVRWSWVVAVIVRWSANVVRRVWVVGHGAVFLMELWVSVWVFIDLLVMATGWWVWVVVGLGCGGLRCSRSA